VPSLNLSQEECCTLGSLFVSCNLGETSQLKQTDLVNLHSYLTSLSVQFSKGKDFGKRRKM
jgi:hypothetical protein